MLHKVEVDLGGRTVTIETGVMAKQANGAVVASIMLLDGEGRLRNGAATNLPDEYLQAIDGLPNFGKLSASMAPESRASA